MTAGATVGPIVCHGIEAVNSFLLKSLSEN